MCMLISRGEGKQEGGGSKLFGGDEGLPAG